MSTYLDKTVGRLKPAFATNMKHAVFLNKCKSIEMQAAMEEAQAKRRTETDKALQKLRLAMGSNNKASIEIALQEALDLSISAAEVQMAKNMMQVFEMNEKPTI
jgi:hypothetical protein